MNEEAVLAIRDYIDEYLFEPKLNWPTYEFRRRSYSRWAANEILTRIETDAINRDPINNVIEFREDMDRYLDLSEDHDVYYIFIVAKETADDIMCLLMKGDKKWV